MPVATITPIRSTLLVIWLRSIRLFMHNADGTYQLDADGNKIYDTTSSYLSNRNIAYEMLYNKQESVRNVLGGQAFATISLPYGLSLTVKGDLNNSTSNNKK